MSVPRRAVQVRGWCAVLVAAAVLAAGCSDDDGGDDATDPTAASDAGDGAPEGGEGGGLELTTVSTEPAMVTGGDVLVRVDGAEGDLTVTADGDDVSDVFFASADGSHTGLVTGLPDGEAVIEATAGDATGTLTVTNHPVSGPVFSGPHLEPFACTTEANGLGPALDEDCSAETVVRWSYVATDDSVQPLDDPSSLPADVATTDVGGEAVPLVIRSESGTIDRGVYWIHVLDPAPTAATWDRSAWNGTLVYRFGGGCGTSYSQGSVLGDSGTVAGAFLDVALLRQGYAQATNTLNTFQVQCNDVLSAEALMMTKERFAEGFGVPDHTVGEGGSGGAIQQYLIAQNYPGLLDAVVAAVPFPDALSIAPGVVDCGLLQRFYGTPAGAGFTDDQRAAVNGHLVAGTCGSWASTFLATIDPTTGCSLEPELVYDPVANPDGARCTLQDSNVNTMGVDPDTGFARRPIDNRGVQYGLRALEAGAISVDQFLDLNEAIGGFDVDGQHQPERMVADADEAAFLVETGRITTGGGDLRQIPVFTLNLYTDPIADIHDRFRSFTILERLRLDDGSRSPNAVLWTYPGGDSLVESLLGGTGRDTRTELVGLAVEWLEGLDGPAAERTPEDLEAARPAAAVDRCVTPDGQELTGGDELYADGTPCATAYPVAGDPRIAAGGPLDGLVAMCTLVDVDGSFPVPFTAEQAARHQAIFPDGVCSYDDRGPADADLQGTWFDYSDGPPAE